MLVAEAALALAAARLAIAFLPFRYYAAWSTKDTTVPRALDPVMLARLRMAVQTAARNVPWDAPCLPQAMAAKAMLARRGVGSCVHLGVGKDEHGRVIAHAWLETGNVIVVGDGSSLFSMVRPD